MGKVGEDPSFTQGVDWKTNRMITVPCHISERSNDQQGELRGTKGTRERDGTCSCSDGIGP